MKIKLILTFVIGLFLVGGAIAGIVINLDRDVELTKPQKDALTEINLDEYTVADYSIGNNNLVERCLIKEGAINSCKVFNVTDLNGAEITAMLDDWEQKRIKQIADVRIERDARPEKVETGSGTTSVVEVK